MTSTVSTPNHPAAANPATAVSCHFERHRRGVAGRDRLAFMRISTFKRRLLAASAAALCLLGCTGPRAQRTDVWKSDSSYSRRISDPVVWSASQFSDSPNASVADARLESFEADIDHDGVSELFITSQRLHGEALGPCLCFRRSGPQFHYIGCLGMNRHSFRVLPLGPDKRPRVLVYWRTGGGETGSGTIATLSNDGVKFIVVQAEEISGEGSSKKYEQAFRD